MPFFWSCCLSLKQKQAVQLNAVSRLLFSLQQDLAALICQFCFTLPPSSWHDWPCLLRPPGNPPACPPQGVCSVIYSASSKRLPCLHFPSSFPPPIKMQKAEQRLVWKAYCWGVTGVYSGGLGRACEHGDFNDLMCTVQPSHTPVKFCRHCTVLWFLPFCGSPVKESHNDALTKVTVIGEEQIIKSLVNADSFLGLCRIIPI